MATTAPAADTAKTTARSSLIPPEEKFWQRYSPHNEAPVSGVGSTLLHILALGLLILVMWVQSKLKIDEQNSSLPNEVVRFKKDFAGGGGGNPNAKDKGIGTSTDGEGGEDDENVDDAKAAAKSPPPEHVKLSATKAEGILKELTDDPAAERAVKEGKITEQFKSIFEMEEGARKVIRKAARPGPTKGQGGSGTDGGRDTGKDKGQGGQKGTGTGTLTEREKRILRWNMTFNTRDGRDYRAQLQGLGAMVAFPTRGNDDKFHLIRELNDLGNVNVEDVSGLDRMYWIDNKPESVRSLFTALDKFGIPPYFAAFFPYKIEKKLLDLELDYAKRKYHVDDEDKIQETKFDVFKTASGGYDVRVREVYLKR